MPHKDTRYYISTIYLKTNALFYDWASRLNRLNGLEKRSETHFTQLYESHFGKNKININDSLSKEYTTYSFFTKAFDLEQELHFNTEGGALCHLEAKEIHENPLMPAYFALVCYNDFLLNQNEDSFRKFWIQIAHLQKIGVQKDDAFVFFYPGAYPLFDVQMPWYSGITQGLVASTFIRAFDFTQKKMYKEQARQAIEAMFVSIENGGVFCKTPEGFDWIEEYPSVCRRSLVLNGFIFSLISIYEYLMMCGEDKLLEERLNRLVESLFNTLHHYVRGSFVRYSRFSKAFQNINYQGLIVFQFVHLFKLSGNEAFRDIALRLDKDVNWAAYFRFHRIDPLSIKAFKTQFEAIK